MYFLFDSEVCFEDEVRDGANLKVLQRFNMGAIRGRT